MFCPQCGKSLPAPAAFCMHCGADLRALTQGQPPQGQPVRSQPGNNPTGGYQPPNPQPTHRTGASMPPGAGPARQVSAVDAAFAQAQTKKRNIAIAAGAGALVLALLIGAIATNFLNRTATQPAETVLQRQAKPPEPMLDKTATPPPPVLEKEAVAPKVMPDDVRRWLEHLEETEKRRERLVMEQFGSLTSLVPEMQMGIDVNTLKALADGNESESEMKLGPDNLGTETNAMKAKWDELKAFYRTPLPPQECLAVANTYWGALDEASAIMDDLFTTLSGWKTDPQGTVKALQKTLNTSTTIDRAGQQTDDLVKQICEKYETKKWFEIKSDIKMPGLFGKMGG